jgi:cytochrome c2
VGASVVVIVIFLAGWLPGIMGGGLRGMMQGMMDDILPPMSPSLLPDPNSKGARLLDQYCTQCHNLPGPGLHTAEQWPAVVERMDRRMLAMRGRGMMMMGRIEAPDQKQLQTILAYLQVHAQKTSTAQATPGLDTEAGRAFQSVCSQCHPLPNPAQRTAAQWPGIIARMKGYMASKGKQAPNEKTMNEIIGFIEQYARKAK